MPSTCPRGAPADLHSAKKQVKSRDPEQGIRVFDQRIAVGQGPLGAAELGKVLAEVDGPGGDNYALPGVNDKALQPLRAAVQSKIQRHGS